MPAPGHPPAQRAKLVRWCAPIGKIPAALRRPYRFIAFVSGSVFLFVVLLVGVPSLALHGQEIVDPENDEPPMPAQMDEYGFEEESMVEERMSDDRRGYEGSDDEVSDPRFGYPAGEREYDDMMRPSGRLRTRIGAEEGPSGDAYADSMTGEYSPPNGYPNGMEEWGGGLNSSGPHPPYSSHPPAACHGQWGCWGGVMPCVAAFLLGDPELKEPWQYRPWNVSWFIGDLWGDVLIPHRVDQDSGFFAGYRIGIDFSSRFGTEMRFGFSSIQLQYLDGNTSTFDDDIILWDVNLLYYPLGERRFRPFFIAGLGLANFDFYDATGRQFQKLLMGMPFGIGMKYRWGQRLVFRTQLMDNLAMGSGSGFNTLHNVSFTAGFEVRFGGARKNYWPWEPGRFVW